MYLTTSGFSKETSNKLLFGIDGDQKIKFAPSNFDYYMSLSLQNHQDFMAFRWSHISVESKLTDNWWDRICKRSKWFGVIGYDYSYLGFLHVCKASTSRWDNNFDVISWAVNTWPSSLLNLFVFFYLYCFVTTNEILHKSLLTLLHTLQWAKKELTQFKHSNSGIQSHFKGDFCEEFCEEFFKTLTNEAVES